MLRSIPFVRYALLCSVIIVSSNLVMAQKRSHSELIDIPDISTISVKVTGFHLGYNDEVVLKNNGDAAHKIFFKGALIGAKQAFCKPVVGGNYAVTVVSKPLAALFKNV